MTKFQKSAIILGVIFLVIAFVEFLLSLPMPYYTDQVFLIRLIRLIPAFLVEVFLPLLLLFNLLQNRSLAAKIAAIIGCVSFVMVICSHTLRAVAEYYYHTHHLYGDGYINLSLRNVLCGTRGALSAIAAVIMAISIGFFAGSLRKNMFVTIASTLFIVVSVVGALHSHTLLLTMEIFNIRCYDFSIGHWSFIELYNLASYCFAAIIIFATCLLFVSAATVKIKK